MSTRFCLIRHGGTAWSVSGQHTGRSDIALTEQGRHESRELGARLRGVTIARVLSSPLLRARQTCDMIGWDAALVDIEPDLAEWGYEHDRTDRPAILLWNEVSRERFEW